MATDVFALLLLTREISKLLLLVLLSVVNKMHRECSMHLILLYLMLTWRNSSLSQPTVVSEEVEAVKQNIDTHIHTDIRTYIHMYIHTYIFPR